MNSEEIYLSYNIDLLMDLYEKIKYKSFYNGVLDKNTHSSNFINIEMEQSIYIDFFVDIFISIRI